MKPEAGEKDETGQNGEGGQDRQPLFTRTHQKRSVVPWLVPLVIILALIYFLPRVMDLLLPG